MSDIKTHSLEELRALRDSGETRTKTTEVVAIEMAEGFWDDAELIIPSSKTPVSIRVDSDVLEFFKAQGKGHLTRMHAVLRSYVEAQKSSGTR